MKLSTLSLTGIAVILSLHLSAQLTVTTNPDYASPLCPTTGTFFFTLTSPTDFSTCTLSSPVNCTIISNIDPNTGTFAMTFSDAPSPSVTLTSLGLTATIKFNISSLKGLTPTIDPNFPLFPANLNYAGGVPAGYNAALGITYCYGQTIPFLAPAVYYQYGGNNSGVPMSTYQWKLPKNWIFNDGNTQTVSTGSNTITTTVRSVGITPDPITGTGSDIEFWVLNNCNPSLTPSNHFKVATFVGSAIPPGITVNGSNSVTVTCGSTSPVTFQVTNPSCVTGYQWNTSGWLYNGNPVSGPFTTTTPTITLTPQPNSTPTNVSVTYIVNGTLTPADTYTETVQYVLATPNVNITGPTLLCSSAGTYTANNVISGSTINWTVSSNLQILSGQGTSSIQVSPSSNGSGTVSATVNNPCYTVPGAPSMSVMIGPPQASLLSVVDQGPMFCPNVPIGFGARYSNSCANFSNGNITNITWSVAPNPAQIVQDAGTSGCGRGNGSGVTIRFNPNPTQYNVKVSATNACGTSAFNNPIVVTLNCQGMSASPGEMNGTANIVSPVEKALMPGVTRFTIAPNPTTGRVLVGIPGVNAGIDRFLPSQIRRIDVYNSTGVLVRTFSYGKGITGTTYIDLGNSAPGVYILSILTDKGRFNEKVEMIK